MLNIIINDKPYKIHRIIVKGNKILGAIDKNDAHTIKICKFTKKNLEKLIAEDYNQDTSLEPVKPVRLKLGGM